MSSTNSLTRSSQYAATFIGHFAWRSILVATAIQLCYALTVTLVVRGSLPLWLGFCLNTVLAYFSFAPVHEAIHGNISGRGGTPGQAPWVDSVFGWMWSVMLITPFSAYRRLHLGHHAHTNHPDLDVNYYVKADNGWISALQCIKARVLYILIMKRHGAKPSTVDKKVRKAILVALIMNYGCLGVLLAFAAVGHFTEALFLWYLPANVAIVCLELLFAYLPHHPHLSQDPYENTRVTTFFGSSYLLMGNDYHIVHHLFPRVPFYRLARVFRAIEPELVAKGVVIQHVGFAGGQTVKS